MRVSVLLLAIGIALLLIYLSACSTIAQDKPSTPILGPSMMRIDDREISQVWVPAGCFMMGSTDEQIIAIIQAYDAVYGKGQAKRSWFEPEQPPHQVCITQGYWLDAYEVTNVAYEQFIETGGYTKREYWSDAGWLWKQANNITGPFKYYNSGDIRQPVVGVSWYEAVAYAKWRGGRLPTEAEWEYAARGPDSLIYPWGNICDGSEANISKNNVTENMKRVGSYESGKSWVGANDLTGNVWEWVADWYSGYQSNPQNDPAGPNSGDVGIQRGGSWLNSCTYARAAYRNSEYLNHRLPDLGFRVVTPAQ